MPSCRADRPVLLVLVLDGFDEPPQAATVIASTARQATAREPRVRVRIDIDARASLCEPIRNRPDGQAAGRHDPPTHASVAVRARAGP